MTYTAVSDQLVAAESRLPLVTKVAKLYHETHLRQPEIAERLNLSQSRVSRLLKQAAETGIVRTSVVSPDGLYNDVEQALTKKFRLIDAVVTEPATLDEQSLLGSLGSAGARYLEATLSEHERLGLSSWSSTLLATVNSMSPPATLQLASEVVQVIGGVGKPEVQVQAIHLAGQFAHITGGTANFFPAPGLVGSAQARAVLMSDKYLGALASKWKGLTTVLAGIGTLQPSSLLASSGNAVDPMEISVLEKAGAVGDVCLRFFGGDGRPVITELDERVLGISRETLLAVPRRIGIAGGERKHSAIRGAILGGWINILVTDKQTALALLKN